MIHAATQKRPKRAQLDGGAGVRPRRLLEGGCCSLRNPFDASSRRKGSHRFCQEMA